QHGRSVQPQAGKNLALEGTAAGMHRAEPAAIQGKPIDGAILDAPHHVFLDAVALERFQFVMQVVALARSRYFACPLWRSRNVPELVGPGLAAMAWSDPQARIRLWHAHADGQANGTVVAGLNTGSECTIDSKPSNKVHLLFAMAFES